MEEYPPWAPPWRNSVRCLGIPSKPRGLAENPANGQNGLYATYDFHAEYPPERGFRPGF